ncbi:hypothetical protein AVEN_95200-1 [Araneus ventricosus]|uniref:Uncharacterized protein n=1 Tax=Araneus ventricosus TaxID=182803 RepID=A0A4Y2J608_ARAVE|nr:hypothetical protein AVEN_95200-1 [Araneus ventricosus]
MGKHGLCFTLTLVKPPNGTNRKKDTLLPYSVSAKMAKTWTCFTLTLNPPNVPNRKRYTTIAVLVQNGQTWTCFTLTLETSKCPKTGRVI